MSLPIFNNLNQNFVKEKQIAGEIGSLFAQLEKAKTANEKNFVTNHLNLLTNSLKQEITDFSSNLEKIGIPRQLAIHKTQPQVKQKIVPETPIKGPKKKKGILSLKKQRDFSELERKTLKRLQKKEGKVIKKKEQKPSSYVKFANQLFSEKAKEYIKKGTFRTVERGIVKSKMPFVPSSYISVLFLSILVSSLVGLFLFIFFLFFSIGTALPIITLAKGLFLERLLRTFWLLFLIPLGTATFMYFYPSLEEKAAAMKINEELPFATIHMASISGSMIDPSKIFTIIIQTKEYPYLEKEFTKLLNEINIYGYDLITALKNIAYNSPSKKLTELLNGLATTISSGGNLPDFFTKRSETLLFDYKIEREKRIRSSETFMDVYISVVIAAPMILMLLLIMMKISGLGFALSTGTITLITVLGVLLINIFFLTFLKIKQPTE
jgi:Flp pilus assembly protein TadB